MPLITVIFQIVIVGEQSYEDKERHCKINEEEIPCKIIDEEFHWKRGRHYRSIEVVFSRKGT